MRDLYIGLMSGTSLDGVDGVLVDFDVSQQAGAPEVLAHVGLPFPAALRETFLSLNTPGTDEIRRGALAGNALTELYAQVVHTLLSQTSTAPNQVRAIGAHGQTVRHRPGDFDGIGFTTQINQPALLAERCGIDVVADFRSRDVAAGGQGAPLVPAFHRAVFGRFGECISVLNLGGISNLTVLHGSEDPVGFDCGPANALMDGWCERHTGHPFDNGGQWAASGQVLPELLSLMLAEAYFQQPPPKSTGRDLFNATWLAHTLSRLQGTAPTPQDVQATLAELTAVSCSQDVLRHAPDTRTLLVCGGGAFNTHLMGRLRQHLSCDVKATDTCGIPAQQVEACAFAWLARAHILRTPGNLPRATGARGPRVLGALYPA